MRKAYFDLLSEKTAFPVYVNYSRSLALEPLFHSNANAVLIFRQWVLCKIAKEVKTSADELNAQLPKDLSRIAAMADQLITGLERGQVPADSELLLSPSELVSWLEAVCSSLGVARAVLLLDDAAHAFSDKQQSEFFEIFRQLRTKSVAPKAAVYPGITSYSPNFHIGHEAEEINAWYDASDPQYLASMRDLIARRFGSDIQRRLELKQEQVEVLAMAAFGIPRGFLNMLQGLLDQGPGRTGWAEVRPVIEGHAESIRKVFQSLTIRLPKFKNFVDLGSDLDRAMIEHLRHYNFAHTIHSRKSTVVGIEEPITPNLERVLHMLEYSGVVRDGGSQSRGGRTFRRYMMHSALIATENALSLGRSFPIRAISAGLQGGTSSIIARAKASTLLGHGYEERCKLSLSPCPKCGTERSLSEQKFCMKCGTELRDGSIYDQLLRSPVSNLPLPERKITDIQNLTHMRTVNDILADEKQKLLSVPYIGPFWAKRIRAAAEEFVSM